MAAVSVRRIRTAQRPSPCVPEASTGPMSTLPRCDGFYRRRPASILVVSPPMPRAGKSALGAGRRLWHPCLSFGRQSPIPPFDRPPFPAGGPIALPLSLLAGPLAARCPCQVIPRRLRCIPNNLSQIRIHEAGIQLGIHARGALLELGAAGVQHLPAILLRPAAQCRGPAGVPRFQGVRCWHRWPHADSIRAFRAEIPTGA